MGDQIDKLKTNMSVKAVVLRHDDHDQEMKGVLSPPQSLLKYLQITYMKFPE